MSSHLVCAALGLLASTVAVFGQSSVWKATRGGSTVYVGGTCHVLRAEDFPLPPEFDAAFGASAKLIFETDISRLQSGEMQEVIVSSGMFPEGTTLQKVLTPAAWKAAQGWSDRAGLPIEYIRQMRPWLFTIVMATLELQKLGISSEGVDMHYFKRAESAGKKTGELESIEHHLGYLTRLGVGHESEMITQSIEEMHEMPAKLNDLLTAWLKGDLAKLDEIMLRELRAKYPSIYKSLLTDRNQLWLPKLDGLFRTSEVEFVLVGAGHLPGRDGLLAQLRARGCTVEQIKAPASAKGAEVGATRIRLRHGSARSLFLPLPLPAESCFAFAHVSLVAGGGDERIRIALRLHRPAPRCPASARSEGGHQSGASQKKVSFSG